MSRIGKRPIPNPEKVSVSIDGDVITVRGPKGELSRQLHPKVRVEIGEDDIRVSAADDSREARSLHGLYRVLIDNMVTGVTKGFERAMEIVGVGYRAELNGRVAVLSLGLSHPIHFELPDGIDARIDKTKIVLSGIDREKLGLTAAKLRNFRPPEPYKGKGVKYAEEQIKRKAGKAGGK